MAHCRAGCVQNDYNLKYTVDDKGVLYNEDKTTLVCYPAGSEWETYTIPDTVTNIEVNAFTGCHTLTTIELGTGLTSASIFCLRLA